MLIYLDTNIISRAVDLRVSEETANAYSQIAATSGVRLVTSLKARREVERSSDRKRASMLYFLLSVFEKVPWETMQMSSAFGDAPFSTAPFGGDWIHPTLEKLCAIFDRDDAEHIFQASEAGCDYFLTLDRETILNRVASRKRVLDEVCPDLRFCSPVELANELLARQT